MILLILVWLWLLAAAVVTGAALIGKQETDEPFCFAAVLGLLALPAPLLAISLLGPLGFHHFAAVFTIVPFAAWVWRRPALPRPAWMPLLVLLAGNAWNSAGPVMLHDTGLYHYPLATWLKEFGTVPGQAVFHFRFGFSSPWVAAAAALDDGWMEGRAAAVFNGLLMAIAMYHFARALSRWIAKQARPTDAYFLAGYTVCLLFGGLTQRFEVSLSPNWPVALAILFLCAAPPATAWLVATAAAGLKLSALPVAALCAIRLRRGHVLAIGLGILLLGPIVAANSVSSGCPLFPSEWLCSEAATSVGPAFARSQHLEVRNWARWEGPNVDDPRLLRVDWVGPWLRRRANLPVTLLWLAAVVALARRRQWTFGALCAGAGLAYVLVAAPDYRFGIGYVSALCGLAAGRAVWWGRPRTVGVGTFAMIGLLLVVVKAAGFEEGYRRVFGLNFRSLSWERVLRPTKVQYFRADTPQLRSHDLNYHRAPYGELCWGALEPCTPYEPNNIKLCDSSKGIPGGVCRVVD